MTVQKSARDVDDEAADWATRLDGRHDQIDSPELQAWLAQDRRHDGALLRAQAALSLVDRVQAVYGAQPAEVTRRPPNRRAVIIAGGTGAIAAGLVGVGLWTTGARSYQTQLGEVRRVPLADGSLIAINTQSSLQVTMKPHLRAVQLRQGEAWFEVAKDPTRPFVVTVGDMRVRAVGTAFSVRRLGKGAGVMVTEGVVETWLKGREDERTRVVAGSKISLDLAASAAAAPVAAPLQIERSLAWRSGQIALDGDRLADAVAEFNRYNQRQIVVHDIALANERFVGVFQLNEPDSFAAAVAATLGVKAVTQGSVINLTPLS
jgi:transmembrane sensor